MLYEDNLCFIEPLTDDDYEYLAHHGVKGQRWYHRLYQNPDGTWTELGKMRRRIGEVKKTDAYKKAKKVAKGAVKVAKATKKGGKKVVDKIVEASNKRKAKKELRKAQEAEAAQKKLEEDIARAIATAQVDDILKLVGNMSTAQLQEASQRSTYINTIRNNAPKKEESPEQKEIKQVGKGLGAKIGTALAAKIYNIDPNEINRIADNQVQQQSSSQQNSQSGNGKKKNKKNKDQSRSVTDAIVNAVRNPTQGENRVNRLLEEARIYDNYGYLPKKKTKPGSINDRLNKLYGWY